MHRIIRLTVVALTMAALSIVAGPVGTAAACRPIIGAQACGTIDGHHTAAPAAHHRRRHHGHRHHGHHHHGRHHHAHAHLRWSLPGTGA